MIKVVELRIMHIQSKMGRDFIGKIKTLIFRVSNLMKGVY